MIAVSMTCPRPVRSRRGARHDRERGREGRDPSARPNGGRVGGPSGSPVIAAKPLIASASVPNPGRVRYGPDLPEARDPGEDEPRVARPTARRSPGPSARACRAGSSRSRRRPSAASARKTSRPPSRRQVRAVTVRLLRPSVFNQRLTPSFAAPCPRDGSARAGCSTLTTSAPKSPRSIAAIGPANSVAASRTRTPSRAPSAGLRETAHAVTSVAHRSTRSGSRCSRCARGPRPGSEQLERELRRAGRRRRRTSPSPSLRSSRAALQDREPRPAVAVLALGPVPDGGSGAARAGRPSPASCHSSSVGQAAPRPGARMRARRRGRRTVTGSLLGARGGGRRPSAPGTGAGSAGRVARGGHERRELARSSPRWSRRRRARRASPSRCERARRRAGAAGSGFHSST